jgi:predicted esterase
MAVVQMARDIAGDIFSVVSGQLAPQQVWQTVNEKVLDTRRSALTPIKGDSTDNARIVDYIKQLVEAEERAGIPPHRIMLVGFSQGGCQVLSCALQMQVGLAGVAALSTWFPQGEEMSELPHDLKGMPLYVAHGDADWVVPVELGRKMQAQCVRIGFNTTYTEYAGLGHDISQDVCKSLRRFFQERVPRVVPSNVSVWKEVVAADDVAADVNFI